MPLRWFIPLATALALAACDDTTAGDARGPTRDGGPPARVVDAALADIGPDIGFVVDCDEGAIRPCGADLGNCRPGQQRCHLGLWGACEGATLPEPERCDGLDDDCDGRADEGYAIGGRCKFTDERGLDVDGVLACASDGDGECRALPDCDADVDADGFNICQDCDDDDRDNYPGNNERCDGRDNDCDDRIDEPFDLGHICYAGEGICRRGGMTICAPDGSGGLACDAVPLPPDPLGEICGDGTDDDCDGQVDEGFDLGQPCRVGRGACERAGVLACGEDGRVTVCSAVEGQPAAEHCGDGLDDDCDGRVDEGFEVGTACVAGIGACARQGHTTCSADGTTVACDADEGGSTEELCGDGRDDDCDGRVDEGFDMGAACTDGVGACARSGIVVCDAARVGTECSARAAAPGVERCGDGRDDDCDGQVDEGFPLGAVCEAGVGACRRIGRVVCTAAADDVTCSARAGDPAVELCNDLDDDCDDAIDEGYRVGDGCEVGQGECRNTGAMICLADGGDATCDALPLPPQAERCDTRDNDCDGNVDEDFPQLGGDCDSADADLCARGYFACNLQTGAVACVDDIPSPEVCNYLDDDCDGVADNDVDVFTDPFNCGACGEICPAPYGSCRAAVCYRDYWVSADAGSNADGDGSRQHPWRTITHAANVVLGPRATIHVLAGTYSATMHPAEFERFPIEWPNAVEIGGEGNPLEVILDVDHRGAAFQLVQDGDRANRLERMRILRGGVPNQNTPAMALDHSTLTLVDVTFEEADTRLSGAVMENYFSDVFIEHCSFLRNRSTGAIGVLRQLTGGRMEVRRSFFRQNVAGLAGDAGGVVQAIDAYVLIENSAFVDNSGNGALADFREGRLDVVNSTFAGNGGTGVYVRPTGHAFIANSIFGANGRYGVQQSSADATTIVGLAFNLFHDNGLGALLQGGTARANAVVINAAEAQFHDNLDGDPRFISVPSGNARLLPGSAAVDRADPMLAPALDLDGRARPTGASPDIGAYEAAP